MSEVICDRSIAERVKENVKEMVVNICYDLWH